MKENIFGVLQIFIRSRNVLIIAGEIRNLGKREERGMGKVLIVIDMQNDFVTGTLGNKEAQAIVLNVQAKVKEYADRGDRIIFTRDTHGENYLDTPEGKKLPVKHCINGTEGWQIVPGLEVGNCEYIDKPTFGWLNWEGFGSNDEIELVGVYTDICVVSNALILKGKYPAAIISVDVSCCYGVTPEKQAAALETMKSCQIDVYRQEQ